VSCNLQHRLSMKVMVCLDLRCMEVLAGEMVQKGLWWATDCRGASLAEEDSLEMSVCLGAPNLA
jgi:hypothetical protein